METLLPGYYKYFLGSKCVFAKGHNTTEVGIKLRRLATESEALPIGPCAPLGVRYGTDVIMLKLHFLPKLHNLCIQ